MRSDPRSIPWHGSAEVGWEVVFEYLAKASLEFDLDLLLQHLVSLDAFPTDLVKH